MGVPKIRAVLTSLALVGAATLTTAATAGPAQSAAASAPPVAVSISAKRVVSMPTTIQPGVNTFKITSAHKNGSSFQLVMPAAGYTAAEASRDIEKGLDGGNVTAIKRFEANMTLLGGTFVIGAKAGAVVTHLDPGSYWALDTRTNDPDKFFAFTVEGADTGNVMPATSTIKAVQDAKWAAKPASIPNKGWLNLKNASSSNHFIVMAKLKKGMTYRDFKDWFLAEAGPGGPPPVNFGLGLESGVVSPGHSAAFKYNLPAGKYVMLCFWPDAKMGGMPHAFMGMHRPITLK